jgi:hypothetical protein
VYKVIVAFLIVWCFEIPAQPSIRRGYKYGWKLGYTLNTITGPRVKTHPKDAFMGGLWFQLKLSKQWTGQAEFLFVEKGIGQGVNKNPRIGAYWVGIYYFEFPLLFQYHRNRLSFEFGPGFGVLTYGHEILYAAPSPDLTDKYPFTKKEVSFNAGLGYSFNEKWYLGLRMTHSILPIRNQIPDIPAQVYSRVLGINLARRLNFKKTKPEEMPDAG